MLQLVLGRAGSGKTEAVYEQIATRVKAGEQNLLLVVPEQFSFESERALLRRLGARNMARVRILSFTRMADTVARERGGFSGRLMDDVTRTLLMSRALSEMTDQLTLYQKSAAQADYVRAVLDMLAECKQYAVTPRQLAQTADTLPEGTLRQKLRELSAVMEAYGALVADSYIDPADALTRLAEQLPESAFARGAVVFVDGFKGFTEQELRVLELLLRRTAETVITLCTDTLDTRDDYALFAPVSRTAARFVRMAQDNGVAVSTPQYLLHNVRAKNEALAVLERGFFQPDAEIFDAATDAVTLAPCADRYVECRTLARTLRRLMREEGFRCRDIAVTARNLSDYEGVLDVALTEAGIPFYMDRREDVRTEGLVALTCGALRCVVGGWHSEELLQMMKTGLLGFSAHSVGLLENYLFQWRLSGRRLREEWTANPEGLSVKADEKTARTLAYLNLLRRRLVTPLVQLSAALSAERVSGLAFGQAVFRYLEQAQVPRMVRLQVRRLNAAGEAAAAERMERVWELLMELLDHFGAALRTTELPAARWEELFSLAAAAVDLGSLPQGLDAVQIGAAERMRFSSPRAVWILGANEGVFPAYPATGGLLTERDRRELSAAGVSLSETGDRQAVEERLYAYFALAAPGEKLFVSFVSGATEEGVLPPSILAQTVRRLVPHCAQLTGNELPESAGDAFLRLSAAFREPTGESAALKAYFAAQSGYAERLGAMQRAAAGRAAAFRSPAAAASFFGDRFTVSASQVEAYYNCRFAYFCRYGLHVQTKRPAELGGLEFGNLAHYVMQTVLPGYADRHYDGVTRAVVTADVAEAVTRYMDEYMGGTADKSERFRTLSARLQRTVACLLWQVVQELRQSCFVPTDYELPVGMEEGVPATVLTLPDGAQIRVVGKIDRVDVYHAGDTAYVRVVDYKTGQKVFQLAEVTEGINLQMLLYVFALWDNGAARYQGTVTPAGVLYLPAKLPVIAASPESDEAARRRERLKTMRMNGLLLDNPEIITAMESDAGGVFIPAKLRADGTPDSNSSVASLAQFGQLKRRAEKLLCDMAATLRAGDIAAVPVKRGTDLDACAFCDFRAVCGHETGDPVRLLKTARTAQVWQALDEAEGEKK